MFIYSIDCHSSSNYGMQRFILWNELTRPPSRKILNQKNFYISNSWDDNKNLFLVSLQTALRKLLQFMKRLCTISFFLRYSSDWGYECRIHGKFDWLASWHCHLVFLLITSFIMEHKPIEFFIQVNTFYREIELLVPLVGKGDRDLLTLEGNSS